MKERHVVWCHIKERHVVLTHDEFFSTDEESIRARNEKLDVLIKAINTMLERAIRCIILECDAHKAGDLYVVFVKMQIVEKKDVKKQFLF
jgi:hypothetical protein